METLKLFALAVFQGVAEFLPISSSGHLAIIDNVFDLDVLNVRTGVSLHFGTLLAIVAFYRKWLCDEIAGLFRLDREAWRIALVFALATVPAVVFYGIFGDAIEARLEGNIRVTGALLALTGVILLTTRFATTGTRQRVGSIRALLVGCAQALALLPGISRSGSTITCARHLGIAPDRAVGFSFIMEIPILLGATVKTFTENSPAEADGGLGMATLCAAAAIAAVVGYFALRIFSKVLAGSGFWRFGVYCLAVGALAAIFG